MENKLGGYLEANRERVVGLLSKLIEVPTVNPPGENYEEMVCFLEKECKKLGLSARKYVTPKNVLDKFGVKGGSRRISLVADLNVGANKTFHINSHYDVVPVTDKWKTDPFKAVIKGNKVYGRGSEDMKANIAGVLFALKALRCCGIKPKINLQLSFTPDEEIGGRTGLGYLVEKGFVKADYAMSEGYSGNYISMGNKGVLWAEVEVIGKSAHGSMPHKGINSFERMNAVVNELEKLKSKILKRKTRYNMRDAISKKPSFVMGGFLEGGVNVNVVPGMTKFSIDRRLIPEENIEIAKKEIEDVIKKFNAGYKDSKVNVKFVSQGSPAISRKDNAFFKIVADSIESITGKKANFSVMPGATDMRYFMWKGIPSLGYSAGGGEKWHSDNEFVCIDSLVDTAKVFALIMSRFIMK
ncbi:MAG: M20 family metallopeptidase [Candidatus Omnitrophota bacterium]|nr:M20 family metallopeptidase [Candidatus Omnitrophota bacterium]